MSTSINCGTYTQWNVCLSLGTAREITAGKSMSHFTAGFWVEAVVWLLRGDGVHGAGTQKRKPEEPPE